MDTEKNSIKPDWGAIINYCCNRFFPPIIIVTLLILFLGIDKWATWAIFGLVLFINWYAFRVGYSVGYCDKSDGQEPNI